MHGVRQQVTPNQFKYRKVASSNTTRLEAHAVFLQVAYEWDFRSLYTFHKKNIFQISNSR